MEIFIHETNATEDDTQIRRKTKEREKEKEKER